MVTLVVATTTDPASIGPAAALLAMPCWQPGPSFQGIRSFVNGEVRLLEHDNSIVKEDHLDKRWEEFTSEGVDEIIFLSKHKAVSNRPALTLHPIVLAYAVTLEATHHGPETNKPAMFVEIGSTEEYWGRKDAANVIALLVWEGLGLGGGTSVGNWSSKKDKEKVLLGIGGGHYVPRHMDIILKDGVWVGHLLSGYSLPMEDPTHSKVEINAQAIGGTWREAIKVSFEATKAAFPGGDILAHLDQKSFKSWQKNAITAYLGEQNIKIGKPADFC
ncbi:hypothetical protein RHGRI_027090 [Rhododendron griersonianum]|uniref:D-aminoacyl-tRNA deacylase n=1 Tax=Rhododendron griersonianum TaxID=479676 RepID=A0AAV6IVV0_9ERIC|nr:hypothetical protein RHGRI_027090 [Rhododendron griersonianum]